MTNENAAGAVNERAKGHLAAISSNVLYGANINITKSLFALSWMTPLGYSYIRIIFGLLFFWTLGLLKEKERPSPADMAIILCAGFLGMVLTQISYTVALDYISPVTMSLIMALIPIAVMLLSAAFIKESFTLKKAIGAALGMAGAALIVLYNREGGPSSSGFLGVLLALLSVLAQAVYFIILRKIAGKYSPVTMMKWMFLLAAVFLSPLCLSALPKQRLFSHEANILPMFQLAFGLVFGCAAAVFLLPVALKRIKASTASMYGNLQPLAASTIAIIAGQDSFSWDKPLALLLIAMGIFLVASGSFFGQKAVKLHR